MGWEQELQAFGNSLIKNDEKSVKDTLDYYREYSRQMVSDTGSTTSGRGRQKLSIPPKIYHKLRRKYSPIFGRDTETGNCWDNPLFREKVWNLFPAFRIATRK